MFMGSSLSLMFMGFMDTKGIKLCVLFIHLFITVCRPRAHCVDSVESEALEAVVRWSVVGRVLSF